MAASPSPGTGFQVLGPVAAVRLGGSVVLGGHRQRALLALLLVEVGRTVSVDQLADELWHGAPPPGAGGTLRVYISRLRSALEDTTVHARPPGYVLDVDPQQVDARRFERLLEEGRAALAHGAAGLASDRLTAALSLWRGTAYADVRDSGVLAAEAARLDELRLLAAEDRFDAELALGRHAPLVAELERLLAKEPLRERVWRQLAVALYRSGRRAEAVAALARVRSVLADDLGLDPGHELQDLERSVHRDEVVQIAAPTTRHNLPVPLTSILGREEALNDLAQLLRDHRLVTLTGAGGAGKTRLALEVAGRQVGAWSGGAWFIDLAACTDEASTAAAVAEVLDVRDRPDASVLAGVVEHLRDEELLLVLDNAEHVVDACARLVHEVLSRCHSVRVLATSRVPLRVSSEVERVVEPLPTPSADLRPDETSQFASVRLFLERGRALRPDFAATPADLATVARICRELDGLPLAIELAAGRTRTLSLDDIADRLGDRLQLLRTRARLAPPRHQTVRAAIAWSHDLLDQDQRALLADLSVFAGTFTVEAAAVVCLGGDLGRTEDLLDHLVDHSLVSARPVDGATRFGLLQTIREYAAEQLSSSGAGDELQRAHAEHVLAFARSTWTEDPVTKMQALRLFDLERDNLHAAVRWALDTGSGLALPLTAALWRYWLVRGQRRQGLEWLQRALDLPAPAPQPSRALALAAAALMARLLGDHERAAPLARDGVAAGRASGPPQALIVSLNVLTTLSAQEGDVDKARRHCEEAVAVARSAGDVRLEAAALFVLAEGLLNDGRCAEAVETGERALPLARAAGDPEIIAIVLARLGLAAARLDRLAEAAERLREAVRHARVLAFHETAAWCSDGLALVAASDGELARAARLLGASESLRRTGGTVVQPAEAAARARTLELLQRGRSAQQLHNDLQAGRDLDFDAATREALAGTGLL